MKAGQNNNSLRVAVVGLGGIAALHFQAIAAARGVQLAAVCDLNTELVAAQAAAQAVPGFADMSKMLAEIRPDMVTVATDTRSHAKLTMMAARAGVRAVHCEKPMAVHPAEAREMVAACSAAGTLLTIIGATTGASLAFFAVRTAFFPLLARRAGGMIERIGPRLRRDGLSYMLVLRLLPVVPFWLVNLAAGMSGMPWRLFALGTVIGIVPATAVFSSIGAGIGGVLAEGGAPDLSVIFSAKVLLPLFGLAALSLLPVIWRQVRGGDARV